MLMLGKTLRVIIALPNIASFHQKPLNDRQQNPTGARPKIVNYAVITQTS